MPQEQFKTSLVIDREAFYRAGGVKGSEQEIAYNLLCKFYESKREVIGINVDEVTSLLSPFYNEADDSDPNFFKKLPLLIDDLTVMEMDIPLLEIVGNEYYPEADFGIANWEAYDHLSNRIKRADGLPLYSQFAVTLQRTPLDELKIRVVEIFSALPHNPLANFDIIDEISSLREQIFGSKNNINPLELSFTEAYELVIEINNTLRDYITNIGADKFSDEDRSKFLQFLDEIIELQDLVIDNQRAQIASVVDSFKNGNFSKDKSSVLDFSVNNLETLLRDYTDSFYSSEFSCADSYMDLFLGIDESYERLARYSSISGYETVSVAIALKLKEMGYLDNKTICDVGSGVGRLANTIAAISKSANVFAIDYSREKIDLGDQSAKRVGLTNVSHIGGSAFDYDYSKVDVVFTFNPFLPQKDYLKFIDLIKHYAQRKGEDIVIVAVGNCSYQLDRAKGIKAINENSDDMFIYQTDIESMADF